MLKNVAVVVYHRKIYIDRSLVVVNLGLDYIEFKEESLSN